MSLSRVGAVARRIILQQGRDHRTLGLLFVVPIVVLSLLGYLVRLQGTATLGIEVTPHPIEEAAARSLEAASGLEVVRLAPGSGEESLRTGQVDGVLRLVGATPSGALEVTFLLEGSDPNVSRALLSRVPAELARGISPAGGVQLQMAVQYLYGGPQFDALDYFAPALIPTFAFLFVFLLTSVGFLRERTQGTFERLMASPLSRLELVLGYMAGFGLFALAQSTVVLLFAVLVLRIDYAGNLGIVLLVQEILTIIAVNLGVLLSGFARNEFQAVQFMPMVVLPQILLAGVFWPVSDLPLPLRVIAQASPLTYANHALREVMIRGSGFESSLLRTDLLVLVGFAALFLTFGALALRRQTA